ncbi:PREDICTED: protein prune homolog isoform X2 [Papilio polytes]|uniref:protein prune homolog isoform X2 n=1 Tax=Papilio polytes TaxID=76194 RepID=UPI000675C68D|nr:PREDICTED: protein prune homolog isoform X2 [Papilio polytes]
MDEFLATTSNKLKTNNYVDLTIVLGNESCDLDSAVSALVYAMFLNWQYERIKCKVCTKEKRVDHKDSIFVPILDVNREDYSLKTEVAYCLKENNVNEEHLVFRDDIDLKNLLTNITKIILVDHHILAKRYDFLLPYVTEIIDHRPRDKEWSYKDDTRSTIESVGSCTTLICQRIKDLSGLMSTILLDTVNFSKEVNKGTPHDREMVLFLETILKPDDREIFRKTIVDKLVNARSDVTKLTATQLLKKDVKIVGDILVPSFPIPVKEFLNKPGALLAVSEALNKQGCAIALLLGMRLTPSLVRDAAVYSTSFTEKAGKLAKYLEESKNPIFGLTSEVSENSTNCLYYNQSNLLLTRKQYIPVVTNFLQNYKD